MNNYDHSKIEKKWRKIWDQKKVYRTLNAKMAKAKKLKPYYVLDMFPYPSGAGLHVGHPRGYIASDVFARMKRMQGYNVLHPMGFDSFGLPAEQYAIKTGKNPGPFTNQLVKRYKEQLSILGFSYDWDRQVATHDPEYYRWTQWIFLQIYNSYYDEEKNKARPISELIKKFEKTDKNWKNLSEVEQQNILMKYRLAYEGYAEVNWCEELGTVLANDEIVEKDGRMVSERGEHPVVKKQMRQWFMRITSYADRLINGLDTIDWPHSIKEIQRNWIGKSEGAEIDFAVETGKKKFVVFDFDGVIGDTYEASYRAVSEAFGVSLEKAKASNDAYADRKPDHSRGASEKHLEENRVWMEKYAKAIVKQDLKMFDGMVEEIKKMKGLTYAFVSSGSIDYVKPMTQDAGLTPTHILAYEDHHSKEEKIENICKDWGVSPSDVVYITDTKADVYELKDLLGIHNLYGCSWGFCGYEKLKEVLPESHILNDFKDIHRVTKTGNIKVFTTRADTLFGVTYVVLAPEHELVQTLKPEIKNWAEVEKYLADVKAKSDEDRVAAKEKTGVELKGVFAVNPANGEQVPVWIADYVLASYGTGAVMAVPAHDERDFEFANKYNLPIKQVIAPENKFKSIVVAPTLSDPEAFKGDLQRKSISYELATSTISGREHIRVTLNRDTLDTFIDLVQAAITGTNWVEVLGSESLVITKDAVSRHFLDQSDDWFKKFSEWEPHVRGQKNLWDMLGKNPFLNEFVCYTGPGVLRKSGIFEGMTSEEARAAITKFVHGKLVTKYKMRDAIFARQRYWGEPIPLIHKEGGVIENVAEKNLPLKLPNVKSYAPTGDGQSPLAGVAAWTKAGYETNTMPGWAGSSWYFLRYADPKNKKAFAGEGELDYWFGKNGGVNMYVGGAEHATGHLLYSRFWHKVLKDLGHVKTEEPFAALRNQGMIGGADGRKMSKRWGNVINPDDVVRELGADTMRVYESFMGPFESHLPWSTDGIVGSRRFIERVWRLQSKASSQKSPEDVQKALHRVIKKVGDDIPSFAFNTAVSAMMIFLNAAEKAEALNKDDLKKFLQVLAPFAPHVTEEMWSALGEKGSIHLSAWPSFNPKLIVEDSVTLGVQVNGKVRAEITIAKDAAEADVRSKVLAIPDVMKWTEGKDIRKFIYVPGKIISVVV